MLDDSRPRRVLVVMTTKTRSISLGCALTYRTYKAGMVAIVSLRADTGPWPACLELCGLVPLNFEVPGYNHIQLAHLVQAYLLDVVRRSWDLGWPNSDDKPQEESQSSALPVEPVLLKLPLEPPKLSSTTFPWPEQFCVDLLSFLKALTWPKQPTSDIL